MHFLHDENKEGLSELRGLAARLACRYEFR